MARSTATLCLLSLAGRTAAHASYVALNPNGNQVPGVAAIGHVNPGGGGETNAYGSDWSKYGGSWNRQLCLADSDGDGQTNGFELGDPCCKWVAGGAPPQFLVDISHPGDKTKMSARPPYNVSDCTFPSPSPSPAPQGPGGNDNTVWVSLGAGAGGLLVGIAATYFAMRKPALPRVGGGGNADAYAHLDDDAAA